MNTQEQENFNFFDFLRSKMNQHLKKNWKINYFDATTHLGVCNYKSYTIAFNHDLIRYGTIEQQKDVILHELAHAIDIEKRGYSNHSAQWKFIAKAIGANPSSKLEHSLECMDYANYIGTCQNCNEKFFRMKKPTRPQIHAACKVNNDIIWKPNK